MDTITEGYYTITQVNTSSKINRIFSDISPGDVIAFWDNGLDAKIIQWFTRSPYIHVAIVLENKYLNPQCQDILIVVQLRDEVNMLLKAQTIDKQSQIY